MNAQIGQPVQYVVQGHDGPVTHAAVVIGAGSGTVNVLQLGLSNTSASGVPYVEVGGTAPTSNYAQEIALA